MAKTYSCEITEKRIVALDGSFQCQNPACRFASPMRIWGEGEGKRTHHSNPTMWENARPITELPASVKIEAKKEAEANAWACARQRYGVVRCPRCVPAARVAWARFAVPA
jgi:hypothetical protein